LERQIAIIDIGSNTIRLTIYHIRPEKAIKEIENIKVSARLQNYINQDQILNPEGVNVLFETLMIFKEIISFYNVTSIKAVATAALRKSKNKDEIKRHINEKTGITIEVLSGEEEAFYGFLGVIRATDLNDGITIDLGGGSIEITRFINRKMVNFHSFPVGVLTLNHQFLKNRIPTREEISSLSAYLESTLIELGWLTNCELPIIGLGGSARSLGKIDQARKKYPIFSIHQYEMKLKDIVTVKETLLPLSFEELQTIPGLSKDRADIIFPAIEVFQAIYKIAQAPYFQLSEKGLRDGVLYDEIMDHCLEKNDFQQHLEKSIHDCASEFNIDLGEREQIYQTAGKLFSSLDQTGIAKLDNKDLQDLRYGCYLYNIGEVLTNDSAGAHTFYLLSNRNLYGFSLLSRIKIALIASYQSKSSFKRNIKPFKEWYSKNERKKLRLLGSILKLACALNRSKRSVVQNLQFREVEGQLYLDLYCVKSWVIEKQETEKQIKHLENVIGENIILNFILNSYE
jgi:exopolyphosphatase / guanosine-5'-triphosphate,3'-diphosphate pyrophosphatase